MACQSVAVEGVAGALVAVQLVLEAAALEEDQVHEAATPLANLASQKPIERR
jgi:hypothetical protein